MQPHRMIELLESRKLFDATAVVSGDTLRIDGTSGNDQITVRNHAPVDLRIEVLLNGVSSNFLSSGINKIVVQGFDGRDTIHLEQVTIPSTIYGGPGSDVIYGSAVNDRIMGGTGNDWINGGTGNDVIYGESGADRLFGGDGKDYLYAGAGKDAIRSGAGKDRIYATLKIDDLRDNKGDTIKNVVA